MLTFGFVVVGVKLFVLQWTRQ